MILREVLIRHVLSKAVTELNGYNTRIVCLHGVPCLCHAVIAMYRVCSVLAKSSAVWGGVDAAEATDEVVGGYGIPLQGRIRSVGVDVPCRGTQCWIPELERWRRWRGEKMCIPRDDLPRLTRVLVDPFLNRWVDLEQATCGVRNAGVRSARTSATAPRKDDQESVVKHDTSWPGNRRRDPLKTKWQWSLLLRSFWHWF